MRCEQIGELVEMFCSMCASVDIGWLRERIGKCRICRKIYCNLLLTVSNWKLLRLAIKKERCGPALQNDLGTTFLT